jgi:hypothetical protein
MSEVSPPGMSTSGVIRLPGSCPGIWEIRADRRDHSRAASALKSAKRMLCRCQLFRFHPCVCGMDPILGMHNRDCAVRWPIGATKVDRDPGRWAKSLGVHGGKSRLHWPRAEAKCVGSCWPWCLFLLQRCGRALLDPRSGCDGERAGERHSRCKPASLAMARSGIATAVGSFHVSNSRCPEILTVESFCCLRTHASGLGHTSTVLGTFV